MVVQLSSIYGGIYTSSNRLGTIHCKSKLWLIGGVIQTYWKNNYFHTTICQQLTTFIWFVCSSSSDTMPIGFITWPMFTRYGRKTKLHNTCNLCRLISAPATHPSTVLLMAGI